MRETTWAGKPAIFWLTGAAALLMVVGGFGPWATVFGVLSVSGTHGDGWIVIVGGVIAAVLLARDLSSGSSRRWPAIGLVVVAVVGTIVTVKDLSDINSVAGDSTFFGRQIVSAGWGIYMAVIGSVALVVCGGLTLRWRPYALALTGR